MGNSHCTFPSRERGAMIESLQAFRCTFGGIMPAYVTPTPDVKRIQQKSAATCWLAACRMLYAWKQKDPGTIDSLLQNATDDRVDYDFWCEAGIGHNDCVPLAKTLGFTWGAGGKLTMLLIVKTLRNRGRSLPSASGTIPAGRTLLWSVRRWI